MKGGARRFFSAKNNKEAILMKKTLSLLMALILCLTLSLPAFAGRLLPFLPAKSNND